MLRCMELGLKPIDLHYLDYGTIKDMLIERGNDDETYNYVATQDDFDRF
jgi:hypothetical protein